MTEFQEEDPFQEDLTTYKISDGSYLVAEELEINGDTGSIFIANPLVMVRERGGVRLRPWIIVDTDEIVELNSQNIISRSNAPSIISKYYFKFIAYDRLIENMEKNMDDNSINQEIKDALDNLDTSYDYFDKLNSPSNSRWNWKAN